MRVLFFLLFNTGFMVTGFSQVVKLEKFDTIKCGKPGAAAIKKQVEACADIDIAEQLFIRYCGSAVFYKLYCAGCSADKMIRRSPAKKEFSNKNHHAANSLSGKGDNKLYNLLQLRSILVDSLAVFDSLRLDISDMGPADKAKATGLFFTRNSDGKKIMPVYDKQQFLVISRKAFCGDAYSASFIAGYMDGATEKKLNKPFDLFFINDDEKKALFELAADLKESNAGAFTEVIGLEYLEFIVVDKYGKVDSEGLYNWINYVKL